MEVWDFDGCHQVEREAELLTRLRSARRGSDGAFILSQGGQESLFVHFNGGAAFLCFFPDREGQHAGYVAYGMWPGPAPLGVRFLQVDGTEADSIEPSPEQLIPPEVAYRASVEFFRSPVLPTSVDWLDLDRDGR